MCVCVCGGGGGSEGGDQKPSLTFILKGVLFANETA